MINQAVIFAGGRGERLKPITDTVPKPMAPVNGVPFLDYLIGSLKLAGIKRVLLLVGYKYQVILEHYSKFQWNDFQIQFSIGTEEDLTGRRLLNAHPMLEDRFLLLYGDNFWNAPLFELERAHLESGARLSTTVFRNTLGNGEYGFENNTEVGPNRSIIRYDKSRKSSGLNGVDIGFFVVEKQILDPTYVGNVSFEEVLVPPLVQSGKMAAFLTDEPYQFITTPSDLMNFQKYVLKTKLNPLKSDSLVVDHQIHI